MNPQQLWDSSAEAWIELMRVGDRSRTLVLDEPMLRLAGDVAAKRVLDVGCGEGRFCRMLRERGSRVVGLEPTLRLVEQVGNESVQGSGEAMPFASGALDFVICYLVLIDIPDFRRAISEMARVLAPGGALLIANLNSFITTRAQAWIREEGKSVHVAVDNYFEERPERVAWAGIDVINYHRPFQSYVQALLGEGLTLEAFEEPKPAEEHRAVASDAFRVPYFHVMKWRKS